MEKIDFVLPWLDGNDPVWKASKEEMINKLGFKQKDGDDANAECRYRDMGLLKYWFRSVEKFAPWVNRIYLVTCGQKPEWLNEKHPKLVLVNHEDFIPSSYLPTFNSSSIEMHLHRIPGLSEHFVLFNDDFFLLKTVEPEYFFKKGYPVLPCNLYISRYYCNSRWSKVCFNDYCTVNENLDIAGSIWKNRHKWFSVRRLGVKLAFMNNIRYLVNKTFCVNGYEHLACPHLKSTFVEAWTKCPDIMEITSESRFRSDAQVNQWLMVAWNLAKGLFYPVRDGKRGIVVNVSTCKTESVVEIIKRQKVTQLCINDTFQNDDPEYCFLRVAQAFESILPEKSGFEK